MLVVQVLSDQSVGLHGPVGVHLWHVHVIQEVDELLVPWGAEVLSCLFLQWFLQNLLKHL